MRRYIGGSPSGHPLEGESRRPGHAAIGSPEKKSIKTSPRTNVEALTSTGHGVHLHPVGIRRPTPGNPRKLSSDQIDFISQKSSEGAGPCRLAEHIQDYAVLP